MQAYSLDPRQRVLSAALHGDCTIPEVAELFGVSSTFVDMMLRLHCAGGDLSPRPHSSGHTPSLGARHHKLLRAAVAANNDATLSELREHLARRARVSVSKATVSRALTKLGLPRKKSLRAVESNNYKRRWFRRRARHLNKRRFIFVETMENHGFIQGFLERGTDERDFYRPTEECLAAVDTVPGGQEGGR